MARGGLFLTMGSVSDKQGGGLLGATEDFFVRDRLWGDDPRTIGITILTIEVQRDPPYCMYDSPKARHFMARAVAVRNPRAARARCARGNETR